MSIRRLTAADETVFEDFLVAHRDSSMFLRANARSAGLDYHGQPLQAVYAGAFHDSRLIGVAGHCWNGMVLVQAPEQAGPLAQACVAWNGRAVTGFMGPVEQVRFARAALGLERAEVAVHGDEALYALDLSTVIVPAALADGSVVCRAPRPEERDQLLAWRMAYDIETLNAV